MVLVMKIRCVEKRIRRNFVTRRGKVGVRECYRWMCTDLDAGQAAASRVNMHYGTCFFFFPCAPVCHGRLSVPTNYIIYEKKLLTHQPLSREYRSQTFGFSIVIS
jgi:hypothetical protein